MPTENRELDNPTEALVSTPLKGRPLLNCLKPMAVKTAVTLGLGALLFIGLGVGRTAATFLPQDNTPRISDDTEAIKAHKRSVQAQEKQVLPIQNIVPDLSSLRTNTSRGLTTTRLLGNGAENEMGILMLSDKYPNNLRVLEDASKIANEIFSTEPFGSNRQKFGVYVLSTDSTPNLDCLGQNPNYPLCNDHIVRAAIDRATLAARVHFVQTMVLVDTPFPQGKSYIANLEGKTSRYNYSLVPSAVAGDGITSLHEFLHGLGLLDEYSSGFPRQEAFHFWPNCVPLPEKNWEYLGTDNPGQRFPGCLNTINGYRDAENDVMRMGQRVLGPADMYWTKKAIEAGLSRYQLLSIPPLPTRIFLPGLSKN